MARYMDARNQNVSLPLNLASGGQAVLCIVITASAVKGLIGDDDSGSVISGVSGLSGGPIALDQDLGGFDESRRNSELALNTMMNLNSIPENVSSCESPTSAAPPLPSAADTDGGVVRQPVAVAVDLPPLAAAQNEVGAVVVQQRAAVVVPEPEPATAAVAAVAAAPRQPEQEEEEVEFFEEEEQGGGHDGHEKQQQQQQQQQQQDGAEEEFYDEEEEGYHEDGENYDEYEEEGEGEEYYAEADFADLEARLAEAEAAAAEAEAVAEEAIQMLETERGEHRSKEAMVSQLQRELEWSSKKAAKERADWEGRMKDSFRKMEGTVLLTERVQREKAELVDRIAALTVEKKDLEAMLDRDAVELRVAAAASTARAAAEAQALIEIDALKKKVREMEEFVEESDAKALQAQGKAAALATQLAGGVGGSGVKSGINAADNWDEVRAAEERADTVALELQYVKAECRTLEGDVKGAREEADRVISTARREAESYSARAADLSRQLQVTMAAAAVAERAVSQSQGRIVLLEDALERSNLQAAELRQQLVVAKMAAKAAGAPQGVDAAAEIAGSLAPEMALSMQQVREVQDAAEGRAAQLAATTRELMAAQEALRGAQTDLYSVHQELADAQRIVSAAELEVRQVREQLKTKEAQGLELRQLQREMANLLAGKATLRSAASAGGGGMMSPTRVGAASPKVSNYYQQPQSGGGSGGVLLLQNEDEIAAAELRASEAESLARAAALQTADVVQQLAASQAERADSAMKITEMREEVARLRSGTNGDTLRKIEALERELVVARNRAEVNNLFKEEHERIAGDLISTKLAWAEGQEQLLVLRRSLVKSQERSMGFAAKLTKLETKLYKRLSTVGRRKSTTSGTEETDSRPGSGASGRLRRKKSSKKKEVGQ